MDRPDVVSGVVTRAFEPDAGRQTYVLDAPLRFSGYRHRNQIFAWSPEGEDGLAWSMVIDLSTGEPVMSGFTAACEEHARSVAASAYASARACDATKRR